MESIKIKGLVVFAHHGLFEEEKTLGQKFILDMDLKMDMGQVFTSGDIGYTVHYGELADFASRYFQDHRQDLIENAADDLATAILAEYGLIDQLDLTITKPWAPVHLPLDNISVSISKKWERAYLGIGTNLGDREENLKRAIEEIQRSPKIRKLRVSSLIETPAWGVEDQPDFLNGAIEVETTMKPQELLAFVKDIEKDLGRVESYRWGPRLIDIDILFYGDRLVNREGLLIPHPQIAKRNFVLEPLMDLNPFWIHPVSGKTIEDLYLALKDS